MVITVTVTERTSGKVDVFATKTDFQGKETKIMDLYGETKASLDSLHNALKAILE